MKVCSVCPQVKTTTTKQKTIRPVLCPVHRLGQEILLYMALRSARIFLNGGLFLGSYCQQLFMILPISNGQLFGAGIRYPERHHRQSKQAFRQSTSTSTGSNSEKKSQHENQAQCMGKNFPMWYLNPNASTADQKAVYLSPPPLVSVGSSW